MRLGHPKMIAHTLISSQDVTSAKLIKKEKKTFAFASLVIACLFDFCFVARRCFSANNGPGELRPADHVYPSFFHAALLVIQEV